jgi:thymidine phosphorylase
MDTRAIGQAAVMLGAGRAQLTDRIDPAVGLHLTARPGDTVRSEEPIATVYARDDVAAERAAAALRAALRIEAGGRADPLPLVMARIT